MKPYRLKHIPTGLYLSKHRGQDARLNEIGRVYVSNLNNLNYYKDDFNFYALANSTNPHRLECIKVYKHDFVKEEVQVTPV